MTLPGIEPRSLANILLIWPEVDNNFFPLPHNVIVFRLEHHKVFDLW